MARAPVDPEILPRRYRLLKQLQPEGMTEAEWARRAGVSSSFFQDLKKGADPRSENWDKVLDVVGVSEAQFAAMDATVLSEVRGVGLSGAADVRRAFYGDQPMPPLPQLGGALGGEYGDLDKHIEMVELHLGEVLDWLPRPAGLASDPDAYVLEIVGDSMVPRFKPRERVAVSPRASVGIGDDVIVQLRGEDGEDERVKMVLIKELVRRGAAFIELKQYNPEVVFQVPVQRVWKIHKVRGHYL